MPKLPWKWQYNSKYGYCLFNDKNQIVLSIKEGNIPNSEDGKLIAQLPALHIITQAYIQLAEHVLSDGEIDDMPGLPDMLTFAYDTVNSIVGVQS